MGRTKAGMSRGSIRPNRAVASPRRLFIRRNKGVPYSALCGLSVAPEKTKILRFSRFHPGMKRRFAFLGFEFYWSPDRQGTPRVKRRTARKKLLGACRRIKEWIKENRHLPGRQFIKELNRRLQGHYQYYGIRGNSESLYRFYRWVKGCAFKWLNRRGGKRSSFTWKAFARSLERLGIARPAITEPKRPHKAFAS